MKTHLAFLKLSLCGLAICAPAYGNITYVGSFAQAPDTASYTITTDGTLGVLDQPNILSASFSDTGAFGFTTQESVGIKIYGTDLTATATTLEFNFDDDSTEGEFFFYSSVSFEILFNDQYNTGGEVGRG